MANSPDDSLYAKERTYFLNNLECQVEGLKNWPKSLPKILESLAELHTLTHGCSEMAVLLGDDCFAQICRDLKPILANGMRLLREDGGAVTRAIVADQIENAVPLYIRDPVAWSRALTAANDAANNQ